MSTIIKGKIQDYERSEKYDEEGYKYIRYWIRVNGEKYTLSFPDKSGIYLGNQMEVVLLCDENNVAVAGLCPKEGYRWGNTRALKKEVNETDRFELVEGQVQEKRKETFTLSRGTASNPPYYSNFRYVTTYTIVLPEKNFRVRDILGKRIKPGTEIAALLQENVGFMVKDLASGKIYGKPRLDYLIALFLLIAFNTAMFIVSRNGQQGIFTSYKMVLIIGNLFFGIAFLISFSGFISSSKTLKIFKQMLAERE